ncbi:MAG TPA: hypothetical protein VIC27_03675 [Ktedonobacterales bacterium]|jgi:hypothetical protein
MSAFTGTPGWDLTVKLVGICQHCGADLSAESRVRATTEWVARYNRDDAFYRTINQAIARKAIARHDLACVGERVTARRQPVWAVSA